MNFLASILIVFITACGARQPAVPPPETLPDTVVWNGDADLAPLLTRTQLGPAEMLAAERIEMRIGANEFVDRLAAIVEDTSAHWVVRMNSLVLLADRGAVAQLPVFGTALKAREERVRMAAVSGMRQFLTLRPETAVEMLAIALRDPSPRIQTRALEILSDRDVEILREFLARTTNAELRTIALGLVRAAEERGAPLLPRDSTGTLQRTTSAGVTVTFQPRQKWPEWDAAVGDVVIQLPGQQPFTLASGIEVVGNVVPVFFTPDGQHVVYEQSRAVHARELTTGTTRKLGDGVAPRILPFTNDVVFLREIPARRIETPNSVGLKYDVLRIPVTGGEPQSLGQLGASALNEVKGNYATVRWMRIREQEGGFYLVGERIEAFELPNPFGE